MGYATYENTHNPHVTIHKDDCRQIKKRGGEHRYKQGKYVQHETYGTDATYANSTQLPVRNCSFCRLM
jgi:hypothetical protein